MRDIDWEKVQPGDPDPMGGLTATIASGLPPCGEISGQGRFPWLCSRTEHAGEVHVAVGLEGVVLAAWGPGWLRELTRERRLAL